MMRALWTRVHVEPGRDGEAEELLGAMVPLVRQASRTLAWYGVRLGRGEIGTFEVFPDEQSRHLYAASPPARRLREATELVQGVPEVREIDVLAHKLPVGRRTSPPSQRGLFLTLRARSGKEAEVERFLRHAEQAAQQEPKTTAWFALRLGGGEFGIFDVFPDRGGQLAHLTGRVPRDLTKQALSLLGGFPHLEMLEVVAEEIGGPVPV